MSQRVAQYIGPGHVEVPIHAQTLMTVVTWGACLTVYHQRIKLGGMACFIYPRRSRSTDRSPLFAAPAMVSLVRHFLSQFGKEGLEITLIGGACYEGSSKHLKDLAQNNIETAREILKTLGIKHWDEDIGGKRARRVLFQTGTGELLVARVDQVRKEDWMFHRNGPVQRPNNESK
jgi:chemotaxis protein CheD